MEKIKNSIAIVLSCVLLMFPINSYAASGTCRCYWHTSLAAGHIYDINSILNGYGYSSNVSTMPSKATIKSIITSSNKVVFIHTHGLSGGGAIQCSDGMLYTTELTKGGIFMAYLSACQSAKYSSTYGSFAYKLSLLGVPRVVGFTQNISATTDTKWNTLF